MALPARRLPMQSSVIVEEFPTMVAPLLGVLLDRLNAVLTAIEQRGHAPARIMLGHAEADSLEAELAGLQTKMRLDPVLARLAGLTGMVDADAEPPTLALGATATLWGIPVCRVDTPSRLAIAYERAI